MTTHSKTAADSPENGVRPETRSLWQGIVMGLSAPAFLFMPRQRTRLAQSVLTHQSTLESLRSDVQTVGSDMWHVIGRFHGEPEGAVGSIRNDGGSARK